MNIGREVQRLGDQIRPMLGGVDPVIQSAVLAALVSLYLAGHFIGGDPAATEKMREELLGEFVKLVRQLVPISERQILAGVRKGSH
jgi:hypothetical protein